MIKRKDTLHFFSQLWESPDHVIVKGDDRLESIKLVELGFARYKTIKNKLHAIATAKGRLVGDAFFEIVE